MKKYILFGLFLAGMQVTVVQAQRAPLPKNETVVQLSDKEKTDLAMAIKDGIIMDKESQIQQMKMNDQRLSWQTSFRDLIAKITAENHFGPDVHFDYGRLQFVRTETKPSSKKNPEEATNTHPVPVNLGQKQNVMMGNAGKPPVPVNLGQKQPAAHTKNKN